MSWIEGWLVGFQCDISIILAPLGFMSVIMTYLVTSNAQIVVVRFFIDSIL